MPAEPITVLVVDDSPIAITVLKRMLSAAPDIQVVGTARNGEEALTQVAALRPAVICTDYHMPVMDGLEFTRRVMDRYPTPILCVSTSVRAEDKLTVFKLLEAGAVDVFPKPEGGLNASAASVQRELIQKVRVLAGVRVFRRRTKHGPTSSPLPPSRSVASPTLQTTDTMPALRFRTTPAEIVAIGASTGGPQILGEILRALPATFPVPVLCVQHISQGFLRGLVNYLDERCSLHVRVTRSGEPARPGTVYFPEENTHLEVTPERTLLSTRKPRYDSLRPAVHVTFLSVAACYGAAGVGVLLTGMGKDGAEGLLSIARAGGTTIAQEEKSCTVFGMPGEAIKLGAAQHILPPAEIASRLIQLCRRRTQKRQVG